MAGIVLLFVSSIFHPGGMLIETLERVDLLESLEAMAEHPELSHALTTVTVIGMLLYGYGFVALLRLPRQGGTGDALLRYGVLLSVFGWGIYIISMGIRHLAVHLMQRAAEGGSDVAALEALSLNVYGAMAGLVIGLLTLYPIATFLTGLGIAARVQGTDILKLASYGLMLMGVAAFINFQVALYVPDIGPDLLLTVNSLLLFFGGICLFVVGLGMYKGRGELTSED